MYPLRGQTLSIEPNIQWLLFLLCPCQLHASCNQELPRLEKDPPWVPVCTLYHLTYCNHIWGNIYQSNLKHLCVLQNKIVRIIAGVKPRESTGPLYDSLGIMKLTDLNKYLIARFMFRYCTNMVPKLFSSYFLRNYNVSSYDLRSANCFHLPLVATDLGKNGIRYRGPIVFNKLLIDGIDCTVSEAVFVNQLKRSIKTGKL